MSHDVPHLCRKKLNLKQIASGPSVLDNYATFTMPLCSCLIHFSQLNLFRRSWVGQVAIEVIIFLLDNLNEKLEDLVRYLSLCCVEM